MLIFDVYTDGEVRQNNGTYSYSYGIWWKCASKYIQKYWWLRSPITNISGVAWRVNRSGVVDDYGNNIHSSYGLISPGTENIDWGFRVLLDGDVRYINTLVINSYGKNSPDTSDSYYAWYVGPDGAVSIFNYNVSYSYGILWQTFG